MSLVCVHCQSPLADGGATGCAVCGAAPAAAVPSALDSLEQLLRANSSSAGRLALAAFQRCRLDSLDDALLAAEAALALSPDLWTAHLIAGVVRNQYGLSAEASDHFRTALKAEPSAVYHKATLERLIAQRGMRRPFRQILAGRGIPALLGTAAVAAVLVPGLLIAMRVPNTARAFAAAPAAGSPQPTSGYPETGYAAPAPYVPATGPAQSAPMVAPQPTEPAVPAGSSLPASGDATQPVFPLGSDGALSQIAPGFPPAHLRTPSGFNPNSLFVRPRRGGLLPAVPPLAAALPPARPAVSPLVASQAPDSGQIAQPPSVGRAGVGEQPTPPPAIRVSQSSAPAPTAQDLADVAASPAAVPAQPSMPSASSPTASTVAEAPAAPPSAFQLQRRALRLQRSHDSQGAREAFSQARSLYEKDIARGHNVQAARYGLDACDAGLALMDSSP